MNLRGHEGKEGKQRQVFEAEKLLKERYAVRYDILDYKTNECLNYV